MNAKTNTRSPQSDEERNVATSRLVRSTAEMVRNVFAPGGHVRTRFLAEINALPDTEVVIRSYAGTLAPRIAEALHEEIRDTFARARDAAAVLNARGRRPHPSAPPAVMRFVAESIPLSLVDESLFSRARNVFFGGIFGCTIGQFAGMVCCKCGLRTLALPVSCAFVVLGLLGGYLDMRRRSCRGHKAKLVAHVNTVLADLQAKYFTPMRVGSLSEVDRCLAVLSGAVPDRLPQSVKVKKDATGEASSPTTPHPTAQGVDLRGKFGNGIGMLRQGASALADWAASGIRTVSARTNECLKRKKFGQKLRQIIAIIRS